MKRSRRYIRVVGLVSVVVVAGFLGAGMLLVGQSNVSPQAIASSVTRTPELMERAWRLPVAASFNRQVDWAIKWVTLRTRCRCQRVSLARGGNEHRRQGACRHGPMLDRVLHPRPFAG